jgi:DNA-directed RNA polymerase specialized sigma24 family protein
MAWQDMFTGTATHIDAEHEQELRLAAQARLGADWALGALIARYQPTVTRYITRLTGNPVRARLLSEQIFLRMERRLHGPHGGQHLRLWLLRASTEAGLDELRKPHPSAPPVRLDAPHPSTLLPEHTVSSSSAADPSITSNGQSNGHKKQNGHAAHGSHPTHASHPSHEPANANSPADRLRAGLNALADMTGSTRRQLRHLIWSTRAGETRASGTIHHATDERAYDTAPPQWDDDEDTPGVSEEELLTPREVLRYRMIRAVLAELPYGDAQCLALHLVAGLNQAEVARALGITASATRRRIVQGLQLFAQRYEAATASLGLSLDTLDQPPDEATETLEAPAGAPGEAAIPSQRGPIVVSARITAPLDASALSEEPTVVWDLPPFAGMMPTAQSATVSPADAAHAEADEAAVALEDALTRRVVWSRPPTPHVPNAATASDASADAPLPAPGYSGDDVTVRVPRPYLASEDSSAGQMDEASGANGGNDAPALVEAETLHVPPPAAMVVEAEPAGPRTARTVPVLTTAETGHTAGPANALPDGARIISVLTAPPSTQADEGEFSVD